MQKHLFIVFEGIDGSGKTTQARMLADFLKSSDLPCILTFEPTGGEVGATIRRMLQDDLTMNVLTEALLFAADRSEHLERDIRPALESGKIVVCDRYKYASIAYQTARGMKFQDVAALNDFAPAPDIVFYIDIDPAIGLNRIRDTDKFENIELLEKVREVYLKLAKKHNFTVLDGNLPAEELAGIIRDIVSGRVG